MRVTWVTDTIGTIHNDLPDDEVMPFLESLAKLGFTAEVTQE